MTATDVDKYLTRAQISPVDVAAQNPIAYRSIDMGVPEPAPFTGLGQRALNHGINRVVAVYDSIERQADLPTEPPRDRLQISHRSTIAGHWSGGFPAGSKREQKGTTIAASQGRFAWRCRSAASASSAKAFTIPTQPSARSHQTSQLQGSLLDQDMRTSYAPNH